ncbi:unnamed protein product [Didymodactylos carnosus]|uniref:J domain-containing protein n=1 Tax=Didymodactylos carnosus TaxID=1234261 RepID=A0A8S2VNT0_9BILA|nr:unnamed protein product [Didymodactylos carnosus]CAF4410056.1 unnamed protein product [Didymodactylos carnosus]
MRHKKIRAAYKRRAREFHPDKNVNDTTSLFQAMELAYETLNDEKRRMDYDADADLEKDDDNDADDIFSATTNELMRLHVGTKFSEVYKSRIDQHIAKYVHERENCEPYERLFDKPGKPLALEEIIGSDVWNWKAVEKTSVYLPIWNPREKWNELPCLIQQLKEPIRIMCTSERYWTLFIDRYDNDKTELMKLPKLLAQTTFIDYLPNSNEVQQLKSIFDKYDYKRLSKIKIPSNLLKNVYFCIFFCVY